MCSRRFSYLSSLLLVAYSLVSQLPRLLLKCPVLGFGPLFTQLYSPPGRFRPELVHTLGLMRARLPLPACSSEAS